MVYSVMSMPHRYYLAAACPHAAVRFYSFRICLRAAQSRTSAAEIRLISHKKRAPPPNYRRRGFLMERPKKTPQQHGDIRDPKLPVIHGDVANRAEQRVCPAPVTPAQTESDRLI